MDEISKKSKNISKIGCPDCIEMTEWVDLNFEIPATEILNLINEGVKYARSKF